MRFGTLTNLVKPGSRSQIISDEPPAAIAGTTPSAINNIATTPTAADALVHPEARFYESYEWCLNPFLTVRETVHHLQGEIAKLDVWREPWQVSEVTTNIYLLACMLSNSIDDYLQVRTYRLPRPAAALPFAQRGISMAETLTTISRRRRVSRLLEWKGHWQAQLASFLKLFVSGTQNEADAVTIAARSLTVSLQHRFPEDLSNEVIRMPSAFRKQDLTHLDLLSLGRMFIDQFPDRQQPILVIGLRSAGSYFAPLVHALLKQENYAAVEFVTFRPSQVLSPWEDAALSRGVGSKALAVVVDETPISGRSISQGVGHVRQSGFASEQVVVLAPIRAASRNWREHTEAITLKNIRVISLEPEKWHKVALLAPNRVAERVQEYFSPHDYKHIAIVSDQKADEFNACLQATLSTPDRVRLKRVYAVRVETKDGLAMTRYVLAKGVGWGWLAYAAFLAASRLAGLVPPLLGLRDGILFTEWLPQPAVATETVPRLVLIEKLAEYIAARVRTLRLMEDPTPTLGLDSQHTGFEILVKSLCEAYGTRVASKLMAPKFRKRLSAFSCPVPTFIDGKLGPQEWIVGATGPVKTDFEHHGFGKHELNLVDPAYDLADAMLQFQLSLSEEHALLRHYVERSGDNNVEQRLFLHKLLAGLWLKDFAQGLLRQPQPSDKGAELNELFNRAWNFLTLQSMRFCAQFCRSERATWGSSLVVTDLDGVLDRRHFGFPTTTAAGIEALRLLHTHGYAIAIDTARSAREVRDYCSAYGFVGGVAEYGSYVYDAVTKREQELVPAETLEQLESLRRVLLQTPGVFVNDDYQYSIRAYTYGNNGTSPLPSQMVQGLIQKLGLGQLRSFQTTIDTTIVSRNVDKGRGLQALLQLAGHPDIEIIAIGDSEPDFPMFRIADKSFAPAQVDHRAIAEAMGCQIASQPYQLGLLNIAKSLVHNDSNFEKHSSIHLDVNDRNGLFVELLRIADQPRSALLMRAFLSPAVFKLFVNP